MDGATIDIPADVTTQNAKQTQTILATQMAALPACSAITLTCDDEAPSILSEQLGFAYATTLQALGHSVTFAAPWQTIFATQISEAQGESQHV